MAERSHRRCFVCGRLLVPVDGLMPWHRKPRWTERSSLGSVPLTGRDQPWCRGSDQPV